MEVRGQAPDPARRLTLVEYQILPGVALTTHERDLLHALAPSIAITPSAGRDDAYDLTPGSWVGVVGLGARQLVIRPKLPIERVLFLISYAVANGWWEQAPATLARSESVLEPIIAGFTYQLRRALARGVLQGYRSEEDALPTVRGRWRIGDQLQRRHGIAPPVEVSFDEYTEDIEPNRLIRAAITQVLRLRLRDQHLAWGLRAIDGKLAEVRPVVYDPRRVPSVRYDRLTERYRPALELARLILAATSFDLAHGGVAGSAFLIDMNKVFEDFVVVALREALGVSDRVLVQGARRRSLFLDEQAKVPLEPDLSLWDGTRCTFVGDAKYKRVRAEGVPNADLYQLLAYTIATGLPSGMLIYAASDEDPERSDIVRVGKRLETVALDLSGSPQAVLAGVGALAHRIRLQAEGRAINAEAS